MMPTDGCFPTKGTNIRLFLPFYRVCDISTCCCNMMTSVIENFVVILQPTMNNDR